MKTLTRKFDDGSVLLLEKEDTMSFPKGSKVLVTDPCYWFGKDKETGKDPVWQQFCDMMFPDNYGSLPEHERLFDYGKATFTTPEGRQIIFIYTSTDSGDGSYNVRANGRARCISGEGSFGVDAGMYAVALVDDVRHLCPQEFEGDNFGCGAVFELSENISVTVDGANMDGDLICITDGSEKYICPNCGMRESDDDGEPCYPCYVEEKEEREREEEEEEENEEED